MAGAETRPLHIGSFGLSSDPAQGQQLLSETLLRHPNAVTEPTMLNGVRTFRFEHFKCSQTRFKSHRIVGVRTQCHIG